MKYIIEAFRDGEVDGVAFAAGDELGSVETRDLSFASVQKALANGSAELVPVKQSDAPPEPEGQEGEGSGGDNPEAVAEG